jgi:hypothetical protein
MVIGVMADDECDREEEHKKGRKEGWLVKGKKGKRDGKKEGQEKSGRGSRTKGK